MFVKVKLSNQCSKVKKTMFLSEMECPTSTKLHTMGNYQFSSNLNSSEVNGIKLQC